MLFPGLVADQGAPSWAVDLDEWMDFQNKRSRFAGYSGLNDFWSGGYVLNGSGIYEAKSSLELALADNGLHTLPTRVNKLTNFNANPTDLTGMIKLGAAAATLTVVDDAAALATAGLGTICTSGNVYLLDNSEGSATATAHITVSEPISGPHTASLFARRAGTGNVNFGLSETVVRTAIPAEVPDYDRFTVYDPDGSGQLVIVADPGAVIWFILNQLEDGAFATPPIVLTGAGATRTGNRETAATLEGNRAFAIELVLNEPRVGVRDRTLLHWDNGSSSDYYCLTLTAAGGIQVGRRGAGAPETASTALTLPAEGLLHIYGAITNGWMKVGVVEVGEAGGMGPMGNVPSGINTLAFGSRGYSDTENTFMLTHRYAELRNVNNPTAAFDKMKTIAQQWAV